MKTNTNRNRDYVIIFAFLLNQTVQEPQPFTHTDYFINKFVLHPVPSRCLVWAWPVVTGCSSLPCVTAQAAFCALGWRLHWWLSWPGAHASRPSASYRAGTRLTVNTAASKYIRSTYEHLEDNSDSKRDWDCSVGLCVASCFLLYR